MKMKLMPDFLSEQEGTSLSIYLPKICDGAVSSNLSYIKHVKTEVYELLRWNSSVSTLDFFMDTLDGIGSNPELVENHRHNLAIFITVDGQWDFRFSGPCKPFFSLANSFHVKPLLRYFHRNKKFFALKFSEDRATLFVDGPERMKVLDCIAYPSSLRQGLKRFDRIDPQMRAAYMEQFEDFSLWISEWISQDLANETAPLLVTGLNHLTTLFAKNSVYKGTVRETVDLPSEQDEVVFFQAAKNCVEKIADQEEKVALSSFKRKQAAGLASTDLKQIAKESTLGNVELLMIAKDHHLWGELNRITGEFKVHQGQSTDLDDDLLDDLAEVVLSDGNNVLVLEQNLLPDHQVIAAIFKNIPKKRVQEIAAQKPQLRLLEKTA